MEPGRFPVYRAGRGGRYTYHGPGQRVVYVMLDLARRGDDVRCYVHQLEEWGIRTLARFGVDGERREGRVGIWVGWPGEAKIAAIGVRVRRWVSYHGMAINIDPDLDHYRGIVPCGIAEIGRRHVARRSRHRRDDGRCRRRTARNLRPGVQRAFGLRARYSQLHSRPPSRRFLIIGQICPTLSE